MEILIGPDNYIASLDAVSTVDGAVKRYVNGIAMGHDEGVITAAANVSRWNVDWW